MLQPTNITYTYIPAVTQQQLIHTYTHAAGDNITHAMILQ